MTKAHLHDRSGRIYTLSHVMQIIKEVCGDHFAVVNIVGCRREFVADGIYSHPLQRQEWHHGSESGETKIFRAVLEGFVPPLSPSLEERGRFIPGGPAQIQRGTGLTSPPSQVHD